MADFNGCEHNVDLKYTDDDMFTRSHDIQDWLTINVAINDYFYYFDTTGFTRRFYFRDPHKAMEFKLIYG